MALSLTPTLVLVDGNQKPPLPYAMQCLIGGDGLEPVIMAASIIAKTYRDALMVRQAAIYPDYGFEKHKGYGTAFHRDAIQKFGLCPLHRLSFRLK